MRMLRLRRSFSGSSNRSQGARSGRHEAPSSRDAASEGRRKAAPRTTIVLASVFASLFTVTEVRAQIPGLVHSYPGDVDGRDTVGSNPGTFENGATAGTPGRVGGAFLFDGVDDYVNLGNVLDLDYGPSSSFTWEAWVNVFGLTSQAVQYVVTTNYACSPTVQALWIYNSGVDAGKAGFAVRDANQVASFVIAPLPLSLNAWHHLTVVRDVTTAGKFIHLYVDCALVASEPDITTATLASNASDFIGRRFLCPDTSTFNGLIDEVRFYDRALTHQEVAQTFAEAMGSADTDGDGLLDSTEVEMSCPGACPSFSNPDSDGDTVSDGVEVAGGTNPCGEDDTDGDGITDHDDNCPNTANSDQGDTDGDGVGDTCDSDDDNDGVLDELDNCLLVPNPGQTDFDGDGLGDVCESDDDDDGVLDGVDLCPGSLAGEVVNADGCTVAGLCPCENSWRSHGDYVSCVVRTAGTFVAAGLITEQQKGAIVAQAGQSNCGSRN